MGMGIDWSHLYVQKCYRTWLKVNMKGDGLVGWDLVRKWTLSWSKRVWAVQMRDVASLWKKAWHWGGYDFVYRDGGISGLPWQGWTESSYLRVIIAETKQRRWGQDLKAFGYQEIWDCILCVPKSDWRLITEQGRDQCVRNCVVLLCRIARMETA